MFKFKKFWCYCDVMVIRIDQFWHEVGVFNLCSTRSVRTYKDVFLSLLIDRVVMISCGVLDYTLIFHVFVWLISSLFQLIVNLPVLIFNNHRLYFDLLRLMCFLMRLCVLFWCLTCVYISIIVFSSVLVYLFWLSKRQLSQRYCFKLVTLVLPMPFADFIIRTRILPILFDFSTWTSIFASLPF